MLTLLILFQLERMADAQRAALDPNRILVAQQAQAMEARAQHREVVKVQPESHLTPEEERQHARFMEPGRAVTVPSTR